MATAGHYNNYAIDNFFILTIVVGNTINLKLYSMGVFWSLLTFIKVNISLGLQ